MSHRGFLVVALAAALAAPVYGQVGPGANLISLDGNIEMMANGLLRMNSKAGQSVLITMSSATKMQYTNKAASEFLRPAWPSSSRPRSTRNTTSRKPSPQ